MPEKQWGRSRDSERAELTADYKKQLNEFTQRAFPNVNSVENGRQILQEYRVGYHTDISFNVGFAHDKDTREAISIALRVASNPQNLQASSHGFKRHEVHAEALQMAADLVDQDRFNIVMEATSTGILHGNRPIERGILQGEQIVREAIRPRVVIESMRVTERNEKYITKYARALATREDFGAAYAILFLINRGFDTGKIRAALFNKSWLTSLSPIEESAMGRVVRESDHDTIHRIDEVRRVLTTSSSKTGEVYMIPDSSVYSQALDMLEALRFPVRDEGGRNLRPQYRFDKVQQVVSPRVIFVGMMEVAEKKANPQFADRERHSWIEKNYSGLSSSIVISAYLQ